MVHTKITCSSTIGYLPHQAYTESGRVNRAESWLRNYCKNCILTDCPYRDIQNTHLQAMGVNVETVVVDTVELKRALKYMDNGFSHPLR
jgi:hypothetical protein